MTDLRPHQTHAIELLRQSLARGNRRPMLQLPTGAGKTVVAAAIVDSALRKGNRVIFTVPALSLIDQTVEAFWREGIRDVGVIQGAHSMTRPDQPAQVASVQTLMRRSIPLSDVVVIDEAHRVFKLYRDWMGKPEWQNVPFIGLSATPWAKGLGKLFDDLIVPATMQDLIEAGYLSPFRVFAPSHPDLSGVRTVAGDYHEGELADVMGESSLVADVVTTWRQRGEGRPTLVFAVDRAHAKSLQKRFNEAGVPAGYVDAYTDLDEREAIRRRFHEGALSVVVNVGCLTTGVDWDVRCIVMARPTKSEMLFVQMIGRGLRTADGKQDCLILDHSDTTLRLGLVTDIRHEKLDDGKPKKPSEGREKDIPLPKECPSCSFLKPAKVSRCPACGFVPEKQTEIEEASGELVEIGTRTQRRHNREEGWPEKISFMAQLRAFASEKGRSDGWVAHAYRDRYGVWPNDPRVRNATRADFVSDEVLSWIKAKDIRYAKSRQKARAA